MKNWLFPVISLVVTVSGPARADSLYDGVKSIYAQSDIPDGTESIDSVWSGKCISARQPNIWQTGVMVFHRVDDDLLGSRFYFVAFEGFSDPVDFNVYMQKTVDLINQGKILSDVVIDHQTGAWFERYSGYETATVRSYVNSAGKLIMLSADSEDYDDPVYCYYETVIHKSQSGGPVVPPPSRVTAAPAGHQN